MKWSLIKKNAQQVSFISEKTLLISTNTSGPAIRHSNAMYNLRWMQHRSTVPLYQTKDFLEHCKDCKDLLKMIVGRSPVLCGAYYTLMCTNGVVKVSGV